eukprot:TRINITY_DN107095_c0_g1_i1.p1 TRINITY_DN107095_c0_g1~~TRINITY_DN107095_c0_g1_i1.p1  ORF type:complete len:1029 (+),score=209.40 TRINITY_DN107095_c0_g1_i1:25-3111(+)
MPIGCGEDCGGIGWEWVEPQMMICLGLYGAFTFFGLGMSITATTSNVDQWRDALSYMQLRLDTSKVLLITDFVLSSIQCIHFAIRTYTQTLPDISFVLEIISAFWCLCTVFPSWGLAHCEGIIGGFAYMLMDRIIPESLLIGSIAALPIAQYQGQKSWFAPSWLAGLRCIRSFELLTKAYEVKLEVARNHIMYSFLLTFFKVYFMAMMMLTFENLGDPTFMKPLSRDKWNTISSTYFVLTSVCTVGFGDLAPATSMGRICTVCTIFGGIAWMITVGYKILQIFAVNRSGGGFFQPVAQAKYIVVLGNPTVVMLRNFLAEIFHPDHAEDADDLHVSVILPPGHPAVEVIREWAKEPENHRIFFRIHIFQGTALDEKDLNRVTISAATCVFVLPNFLCTSVMQEDTENIIRMMAAQRLVPKVRMILLLLRAENRRLLIEAHMDTAITTVAYDQFKLELAGKSCQVHGFGSLVSNLCKSIALDDDDDDEEEGTGGGLLDMTDKKPTWKKDFERGCGLEVYEVELSQTYAQRDATFIEAVVDIIEQTGGLVYLIGLVESRPDGKRVLINPGPTYAIKQAVGGIKIMGVFLASDREAIMQCDLGMVFLGRRERASEEEEPEKKGEGEDLDIEPQDGPVRTYTDKAEDIPELMHVHLPPEQKAAAVSLARTVRRHQRSLKPQRPPLKMLAAGGHIVILTVGTESTEDLRLGVEHFVKPLRQNVAPDEIVPVVVMSAVQPRDWSSVEEVEQVYFLQGSPTSLMDLERVNFSGASAIFISHCGAGRKEQSGEETWSVDFEVICCTRLVESQLSNDSGPVVITDIVVDTNHPFLPLPGQYGGGLDNKKAQGRRGFRARGSQDAEVRPRRSSITELAQAVTKTGGKPKKLEDYFVQPRFAAGRLLAGGTTFTSLAANTFYNPTLIDLVSCMITTQITMVRLPPAWEGKSYFELFDYLLWKQKLLAVGIYREADMSLVGASGGVSAGRGGRARVSQMTGPGEGAKTAFRTGFVYTAPPGKETAMMPGDQVICFQARQEL